MAIYSKQSVVILACLLLASGVSLLFGACEEVVYEYYDCLPPTSSPPSVDGGNCIYAYVEALELYVCDDNDEDPCSLDDMSDTVYDGQCVFSDVGEQKCIMQGQPTAFPINHYDVYCPAAMSQSECVCTMVIFQENVPGMEVCYCVGEPMGE